MEQHDIVDLGGGCLLVLGIERVPGPRLTGGRFPFATDSMERTTAHSGIITHRSIAAQRLHGPVGMAG